MEHAEVKEARERMHKCVESYMHELTGIRTGRASVGLLDSIDVEIYGTTMKLNQVGTVGAPEARLLTVTPWDKSQIPAIEKAILSSPLELTPSNDGHIIRIPVPALNEERRRDLVKLVGKLAEEARVAIRNVRRHEVEQVKKKQKEGELPEDDAHRISEEIQKVTDSAIAEVDEALKHKEADIMEV